MGNTSKSYTFPLDGIIADKDVRIIRRGNRLRVNNTDAPLISEFSPAWAQVISRLMTPEHVTEVFVGGNSMEIVISTRWNTPDAMRGFYESHFQYLLGLSPASVGDTRIEPAIGDIPVRRGSIINEEFARSLPASSPKDFGPLANTVVAMRAGESARQLHLRPHEA